jgi:hypothetical protein
MPVPGPKVMCSFMEQLILHMCIFYVYVFAGRFNLNCQHQILHEPLATIQSSTAYNPRTPLHLSTVFLEHLHCKANVSFLGHRTCIFHVSHLEFLQQAFKNPLWGSTFSLMFSISLLDSTYVLSRSFVFKISKDEW